MAVPTFWQNVGIYGFMLGYAALAVFLCTLLGPVPAGYVALAL